MFPSSVRRVVVTAPHGVLCSSAPKAGAAASAPLVRGHQRRCSSSKPSRSDNGSENPSSREPAVEIKSKPKQKKSDKNGFAKLPSVPSTHHMPDDAITLSSFFSQHRPISVTQSIPRTVTNEHFASIFTPRTKADKVTDTMSLINGTIDQIEGSMGAVTIHSQNANDFNDGIQRIEMKHPDGSENNIQLQVDAMSGDFFPFRPPPAPQPESAADSDAAATAAAAAEGDAVEEVAHPRTFKAMITIEEIPEKDGQVRFVAHSPSIVYATQPRSFVERLAKRQLRFNKALAERKLYAISVRRQRKLKMKKKKYKKFMRKTRNLRRKLDRT